MSTTTKEKKRVSVVPFAVEIDHHRNADCILPAIPGERMRSRFSITKTATDYQTGEPVIPKSQTQTNLPEIPGMILYVNPGELTYEIIDPLCDDEVLCEKIAARMRKLGRLGTNGKVSGVPKKTGTIDVHRMKTLCRDLLEMLNRKDCKLKKGIAPSIDDINELPGKYLLNPGCQVQNQQPRFEKDWDQWVSDLTKHGG